MKKYKISVNGKQYEVDVEEVGSEKAKTMEVNKIEKPEEKEPESETKKDKKPEPVSKGDVGSEKINAPMPGTVLSVNVQVGQDVTKGDLLCVLEAMKMENDIISPRDGKIASVNTGKGASVNAGDLLISLE